MKIGIAWESKNRSGGGWSFAEQFVEGIQHRGHSASDPKSADAVLIPSASVITRRYFRELKQLDVPIVLRVDNALRDSRNGGVGMTRMKEMASNADMVVYQGSWSQEYLSDFCNAKQEVVIHNGINLNTWTDQGKKVNFDGTPVYLYSCASKGCSKRWHYAWYRYQEIQRENPEALFVVVGSLPSGISGNLDFFNNERYRYMGYIDNRQEMSKVYRGVDRLFACYDYDCFSQTYIEALCCGVELFEPTMNGGTPEIIELWEKHGAEYFDINRMIDEYLDKFNNLL